MLLPDYTQNFIKMRDIGRHAAACLDIIGNEMHQYMSTQDIDDQVYHYAQKFGLICAPFNYKGFPANCCTSVNHVVCHGIPSDKKILREGDIVKVDVTFKDKDGWHGDSCRTYAVGTLSAKADRLVKVTRNALQLGIEQCRKGNTVGMIGAVIQRYVEGEGFSTVRDYVGHGIGQEFHIEPHIYHYETPHRPGMNVIMKPGMMFTIEPMINAGKAGTKIKKDGWTVVTKDRSLSAQFEHTIGITEDGCEIFTRSENGH